jgi:hypothetical protein
VRLERVRFSWVLPLAAFLVWDVLVLGPAVMTYCQLVAAAHGERSARMHSEQIEYTVPRDRFLWFSMETAAVQHHDLIRSINFPGLFTQALISLPISWPNLWRPKGTPRFIWEALVMPFYCLPAWWFVGRGVDGLREKRRVNLASMIIGLILGLALLTVAVGFSISISSPAERADLQSIVPSCALWGMAFNTHPVAWLRQRLRSRGAVLELIS